MQRRISEAVTSVSLPALGRCLLRNVSLCFVDAEGNEPVDGTAGGKWGQQEMLQCMRDDAR